MDEETVMYKTTGTCNNSKEQQMLVTIKQLVELDKNLTKIPLSTCPRDTVPKRNVIRLYSAQASHNHASSVCLSQNK